MIAEIKSAGLNGKRGKPIEYTQIYEILRNVKYTGLYIYSPTEESDRNLRREKPNAIKIEGAIPKIIDKALFMEVQNIMNERKQTGKKSNYICSGLVYCGNCGSKMYGTTTKRKGHEYKIYYCTQKCGTGTVKMDDVDDTVQMYLSKLLSINTIETIKDALQRYTNDEKLRVNEFNASVRNQINEAQKQIDNYMLTLSSGALPSEVISDVGEKIVELKAKIKTLSELPVPKDYTSQQINLWLDNLKNSTNKRETILLLVESINATKTEINVKSTLTTVLCENGCGSRT